MTDRRTNRAALSGVANNFAVAADVAAWKTGVTVYSQWSFTGDVRANLTAGKVKFYITSEFVGE